MFTPNPIKLLNIIGRKPRLLTLGVNNLRGQLFHIFFGNNIGGYSPPPEQLTLLVTDACNFRCPMCQYVTSDSTDFHLNRHGPMEMKLFGRLLDQIPGKPLVAFAGGEPLLHPQINELVTLAHASGHPTWLTTNGWFLLKHANALCDAGLDFLVVSLDGPELIHDSLRGQHAFERVAEGVEALMTLPGRPVVFINMAISDLNYGQIIPVYEFAEQMGVDGIDINHLWMHTNKMVEDFNERMNLGAPMDHVNWNIHPEAIDTRELIRSIDEIKRRSAKSRLLVMENPHLNHQEIRNWYAYPEKVVKWRSSRCAWNRMRIWPDGSVKACRSLIVGNLSQDHAMQVWNGLPMKKFRQTLSHWNLFPICVRCCDLPHR